LSAELAPLRTLILVAVAMLAGAGLPKNPEDAMKGTVSYLNPHGLHRNPAFFAGGGGQWSHSNGQRWRPKRGRYARVAHVEKWTIYVVKGQPVGPAMGAFQQVLGPLPNAVAMPSR